MTITTEPFSYGLKEFLRMAVLVNLRRFWWLMLVCLGFAIYAWVYAGFPWATAYFLVFLVLIPILRPLRAISGEKARRRLAKVLTMEFTDTDWRVFEQGEMISKMRLEDLEKAVHLADFWLIRIGRMVEIIIPDRVFKSKEDVDFFASTLRKHKLMR